MADDKAGKSYWDALWKHGRTALEVELRGRDLNQYVNRKFHRFFIDTFRAHPTASQRLLEIGCAKSSWLPYFAKEFRFDVVGLDYSEVGCAQARRMLADAGVKGEVICADLFTPPEELLGTFDLVVSFGVVEHFEDTAACLSAFARFLKPGGMLLTSIPNLAGWIGSIQRMVNRRVFDIHVPLDSQALAAGHRPSLEILSCEYFLTVNWGVINIENWSQPFHRLGTRLRSWASKGVWILEERVPLVTRLLKPNRLTSPYINCVARKP
jgi:cyclopropane fatty-acyl-phospholipid synthase-like methyltransferase